MHVLVPFAAPIEGLGGDAWRDLRLPQLRAWLARGGQPAIDSGDALSLTPPHERAWARCLGIAGADGELPLAAQALRDDGRDPGDLAWGLLTPVHWQLGSEQATLADPATLALDEAEARALFETAQPLFEGEGWLLVWGAAQRWYLAHESLAGLRTASLDRAVGRSVDHWQGNDPAGRRWRRLQSEVQMVWHEHPVNRAREGRGALAVNSLWLSGCGVAAKAARAARPQVVGTLRGPALAGDVGGWREAWEDLDRGLLRMLVARARAGQPASLTLCGDRGSATWSAGPRSWARRLGLAWRRPDPAAALEGL